MDANSILLITVITIVTVLLTLVGFQLFFVLRDLRKFLVRINNIAAEFEKIGINASHGYSELVGFLSGVKNIFYIIDMLSKKKKKNEHK